MTVGQVKNWAEFQHYKDRSPPWIKLHRGLLDDFNFTSLPLASKALAPLLWLLAAESSDGSVSLDPEWLAWRLRIPVDDVREGLSPLIERGFLISASKPLASRKQVARPEGEGEGETEREARASKGKSKAPEVTLPEWIEGLAGGDALAADDPLFAWAEQAGIPRDWIALAWWAFEARYTDNPKRYADWRAVFRRAAKEDWLKLWRVDRGGGYSLTTAGEQVRREMGR
jgi:hypothetical protein